MLRKYLTILILFFIVSNSFAQDIPIGTWRDHLPYSDAISVTISDKTVYCATSSAVFMYDKSETTIERLNLVNGLSDIGLSKIKYNSYNGRVIIAYKNGNIDVIDENKNITNLSFIKNSSVVGNKSINHIYLQGKLAYLSTGFGIVVLDTDKLEIVDTYLFGPLGSFMITNAVTMDSLNIYAATDNGIYYANKNSLNLNDYNVWNLLSDMGTTSYGNIVSFASRLFASSKSSVWSSDTLYSNDGGVWQKFLPNGLPIEELIVSNNRFIVTVSTGLKLYDTTLTNYNNIYTVNNLFFTSPRDAVIDDEGILWYAESNHGLIKSRGNWDNEIITPNSPSSAGAFAMDFVKDELWVVSGGYGIFLSKNLINHRSTDIWNDLGSTITDSQGNTTVDMVSIAINPNNSSNVYAGSWSSGLYEYNNDNVSAIYNAQNSVLDSTFFGSTATGTIKFDNNANLWIASSFSNNILSVKTAINKWYSFSFPGLTTPIEFYTDLVIDQNNYKWLISPTKKSIIVFDDNNTIDNTNDDRVTLLIDNPSSIFSIYPVYDPIIPGTQIKCITEDLDGEIWVGTDEGVAVFYNPSAVFDENIKAEQIYIQQDGQTQILLETEVVTVIAVDGANRKWIGTQNSGVFLMSADGTEQIEHFTRENSPLFSNNIFDIVINPKTGEVFFGTEKGLISYKGTATDADNDFNNIFVYPNPVMPDFNGTIAIRGLVKDTDVKITDISGNIVYQTTSLGGQAIWDGKDFNGNKVQTGVYMIFNGSPDGNLKAAAKILIYH